MTITKKLFGRTVAGEAVEKYTLTNRAGASAAIITYGGAIQSLLVPDKTGALVDVSLGCATVADYERQNANLGALIGRFGNRIGGGKFTLNGTEYKLYCNDGNNHLHGGKIGYNRRVWAAEEKPDALELTLLSPDGEEGYPGNLTVKVLYSLSDENELSIVYTAVSDSDTVVNLTNHCYFNLEGEGSGSILGHQLRMNSAEFTENSDECLPTGVISPVEGTPLDFRTFHTLGERIDCDDIQLKNCGGYDHNFIIARTAGGMALAAELWSEKSGILMKTFTTKPGVQLYSGNFMNDLPGKGGKTYGKREGVCLETQFYPNAMACENFPSPVLKLGETYHHATCYRFEVK